MNIKAKKELLKTLKENEAFFTEKMEALIELRNKNELDIEHNAKVLDSVLTKINRYSCEIEQETAKPPHCHWNKGKLELIIKGEVKQVLCPDLISNGREEWIISADTLETTGVSNVVVFAVKYGFLAKDKSNVLFQHRYFQFSI